MYAYLGMVLQGEMIQALFTGLRPLVFLLLIIGVVWGIGSMMIRGRAHAVLSSMINILDRGFGRNVAFETTPFASTRGMMWAMAQTMDDAETIREAGRFLSQCLGPAETSLQNSNLRGSISGIFGGLGDLVNRPDDQAAANTRAALQELVPVDTPATCLEWANQIKSRFGTWLDSRRTLLTERLPQLPDA